MNRERAVRVLLHSRNDWVPAPLTSTGSIVLRSASKGEAPSKTIPCPSCEHSQVPGRLANLRPCRQCGGDPMTGHPGRGVLDVDDYTGRQVRTEEQTGETPMVMCDGCGGAGRNGDRRCDRCRGSGRVPGTKVTLEGGRGLAWEDDKARMWKAGSYAELEHALELMRSSRWMDLYDAAIRVGARSLGEDLTHLEQDALEWLETMMPATVKVPPWLTNRAEHRRKKDWRWRVRTPTTETERKERDDEIRRLRGEGWSIEAICREVALAKSQVYGVLRDKAKEAA